MGLIKGDTRSLDLGSYGKEIVHTGLRNLGGATYSLRPYNPNLKP